MIDLVYYHHKGYAKQKSSYRISYNKKYYNAYKNRGGTPTERALMQGRADFVNKYRKSVNDKVLDIGVGNGEFVRIMNAKGVDVNPDAIDYLKKKGYYGGKVKQYDFVCMWDVLEHLENFAILMDVRKYLFISIPVYDSLYDVHTSKHFKPGEHLWYFTETGLVALMHEHELDLMEKRDFEKKKGRNEIYSYCFKRRHKK